MYNRYYRYSFGPQITPVIKNLIIANVIIFFLQSILDIAGFSNVYLNYFALSPVLVFKGYLWQMFTYMFLHGNLGHLIWNMFGLWMFGTEIEGYFGSKRFLNYYLFCGFFASVTTCLLGLFKKEIFFIPTIGASGSIYGILMAYGLLFPNRIILAFFVLPMKAIHFVLVFGLIQLLYTFNSYSNIAYVAHVGGMLGGYLFLRYRSIFSNFIDRLEREKKMKNLNEDLILQEKVNRLLEKINQYGIHSLSENERKFLHRASERLKRRKEWYN